MEAITFELLIDKVPYSVKAIPFTFNDETRFRVTYNNSPEFIFAWDPGLRQFTAIDHEASMIPDTVETAIAAKLQGNLVS